MYIPKHPLFIQWLAENRPPQTQDLRAWLRAFAADLAVVNRQGDKACAQFNTVFEQTKQERP